MMEIFEDRRYVTFNVNELPLINFDEVFETSVNTLRTSFNGEKTFVKYDLPQPPSVQSLTTKSIEYTHEEMLLLLSTEEWKYPDMPFIV